MKKILILISVIASVVAISCKNQVEPTAQFAASKGDFSVTPSSTSVTATQNDSASAVLTLTWADPKYATGLTNSSFTVYVAPTNTNFVKFASRSYSGVLSANLLGNDLNGMALQVGGVVGQTITLDIKVIASQGNNNEQKTSNVIQVTYSPYGDLALSATSASVTASAAHSADPADTLSWSVAFKGFSGVKTYWIQYAQGGSNFASPVSTTVTSLSQIYTQLDLNKIALAMGVAPGASGNVDFRIKAANELKDTIYSNVVTINVSTYVAYNSIGLIGDATAGGWNVDTDMHRPDPINSPSDWTLTTYLTSATYAMQFRADDAWVTQWGGTGFPSGTGTQTGGNIPLTTSGWYQVDFNAGTGAYMFTLLSPTVYTNVSLIGGFNGWGGDVDLTADATGHIWTGNVSIPTGLSDYGIKFRANHDWTTSWGNAAFPSGYSTGDNINILPGNYFVYFNDVSGEYFFGNTDNNSGAGASYNQISLIGDFNGWGADAYLIQNPTNPYKWSAKVDLTAGGTKFRANTDWTTSWGGATFPTGQGTTQNDPNINVTTGNPQVTFNSATGEYSFTY